MASFELPSDDSLERTYVVDAESAVEMARLLNLDRLLTSCMGGLLPEQDEASIQQMRKVLDIACGPGGWVCDMARAYPHMQVTGIDTGRQMMQYARQQAAAEGLHNAQFSNMNALKPLDFPDASFDLVNIRSVVGFVPTAHWPLLIKECLRVLRPGGLLRLSEAEAGFTNMPYTEAISVATWLALHRAGRGCSPNGKHIGMVAVLSSLLKRAGLQQVRYQAHAIDYSYGTVAHSSVFEDTKRTFLLARPLIRATNAMRESEYNIFYEKAMQEMQQEDFCGVFFLLTAWGVRPG